MNNIDDASTTITIVENDIENDDELKFEFTLCDYMCFFIQISLIFGLIYILMLSFYFLYRIIEIIAICP